MTIGLWRAAAGIGVLAVLTNAASAQDRLRETCRTASAPADVREFCELAAYAVEPLEARLGIVSIGGNPVPGTASTFGPRIGPLPRVSAAARFTLARVELPPIGRFGSNVTPDATLASLNADASVGLFPGIALLPTAAGFLAIDLLASAGLTWIPDSDGFDGGRPFSWALGARLGILRESFTVPGVSLSAMYRRFGDMSWGPPASPDPQDPSARIQLDARRAWSMRAAVSKRVAAIGLAGGAGWDFFSADALLRVTDPDGPDIEGRESGASTTRFTAFANAGYTALILSIVAELGWQEGGDSAELPAGRARGQGGAYGGLAVRVAI